MILSQPNGKTVHKRKRRITFVNRTMRSVALMQEHVTDIQNALNEGMLESKYNEMLAFSISTLGREIEYICEQYENMERGY